MPSLLIRDQASGKAFKATFDRKEISIGSHPRSTIPLRGEGVSREHCVLYHKNGRWLLRDLGSRNGTWVDTEAVTGPVVLEDGSQIILGTFRMTFRLRDLRAKPTSATPAAAAEPSEADVESPSGESSDANTADDPAEGPPATVRDSATDRTAPASAAAPAVESVAGPDADFVRFKKTIHDRLIADKRMKQVSFADASDQEVLTRTTTVIRSILETWAGGLPQEIDRGRLEKELIEDVLGLGPLEDLLADDGISEIMVDSWDRIFVEQKGRITRSAKRFLDDEHVVQIIRRIIAPIGRRVNESTPMVDARLKDGSRVNAVIPPISLHGPSLTIRKFMKRRLAASDMIRLGSLTEGMATFLNQCVMAKFNLLISGGTGTGKTTLLNMIANFIPADERIVTVEDVAELRLPHLNLVTMETRPPNLEGQGEIPIRKLVINSLRMRPDRIIVGECRGGEAFDMLQAMNTGHEGSLTTVHANSPRDAVARLENLVLMAGMDLPARAIREQIASALNLIVQIQRFADGSRRVVRITEISGMEGDVVCLNDIFWFEHLGMDEHGKIKGRIRAAHTPPRIFEVMKERGIEPDLGSLGE